jgi:hypothetical protein
MATFTKIASNTVSTAVSSITFSSIPATFTDLVVKASSRANNASIVNNMRWTFNASSTGYSYKELYGDGTSAASGGASSVAYAQIGYSVGNTATANTFANTDCYIPNYASANYKSFSVDSVAEHNATGQYMDLGAALWSNSAAITSVTITPSSGDFMQYSTFTLYGIKNS